MKNKSLFKKVLIGVVSLLFVVVAVTAFSFLYEGSTRPILSVADKFTPDSSWNVLDTKTVPPRIACVDGVRCPSVHRVWGTGSPVSKDYLKKFILDSGISMEISGDCVPKNNALSGSTVCNASGEVDSMTVEVRVSASRYDVEDNKVILYVY